MSIQQKIEKRLLLELYSNWVYKAPKDKEKQLYDFYALSLVNPELIKNENIGLSMAFEEARETISNFLIKEFKQVVLFSLASEFRHVGGLIPISVLKEAQNLLEDVIKNFPKFFEKYLKYMPGKVSFKIKGNEVELKNFNYKIIWKRKDSYKAILKTKYPPKKLTEIFKYSFMMISNILETTVYGSKPWVNIAKAWNKLFKVKNLGDKIVLIDHIYDLQHNTDTIFTKIKEYSKDGGYVWLKNALDFKKNITNPFELYNVMSAGLKGPFAYYMKQSSGITLQKFKSKIVKVIRGDRTEYRKITDNKLHREDGPAIIYVNGDKFWYINGKIHREDGPAVEYNSGTKEWWINGKIHREDGPAVIKANGTKLWYKNDKLHREDGPAVEYFDGTKGWYINGKQHREDGPAIEYANGDKEWWINGKKLSEKEIEQLKKKI